MREAFKTFWITKRTYSNIHRSCALKLQQNTHQWQGKNDQKSSIIFARKSNTKSTEEIKQGEKEETGWMDWNLVPYRFLDRWWGGPRERCEEQFFGSLFCRCEASRSLWLHARSWLQTPFFLWARTRDRESEKKLRRTMS